MKSNRNVITYDEAERARLKGMLAFEEACYQKGYQTIAGLDEAGRGPLAGPVVAGAVVLPPGEIFYGIDDSKRLTPRKRSFLYTQIYEKALAVGVGVVDHEVIDEINILQATLLAMKRALENIEISLDFLLVDALSLPFSDLPQKALIKGDQRSLSIAAASIIAKVTRDKMMQGYHQDFPKYGFQTHKGYPTAEHLRKLKQFGPCAIHRLTFRGVKQ